MSNLKELSIGELFDKLHTAIFRFIGTIDEALYESKEIAEEEILSIRNHITERLKRGEDISENQKIIKILDSFSKNRKALELIEKDMDEWMSFLEIIEEKVEEKKTYIGKEEMKDLEKITKLTAEIKAMIRK